MSLSLRLSVIFFVPLVFFQGFGKQTGPAPDSSDIEFSRLADRWLAAYNGTDATKLTPLYARDARYISGHVTGLVANGRDAVIANFQKGMSMGGHIDRLKVLSIQRSCDLATVLCQYDATNAGQKASGKTLLVCKKIGHHWQIILHMTVV
jgi:ketosteroid isomerase-like protein